MTEHRITTVGIVLALAACAIAAGLVCIPTGCAALADVEEIRTDVAGLRTEITTIGTQVGDVTTSMGDIGGGVDTITTVAAVAGLIAMALSYPVGRLARLKLWKQRKREPCVQTRPV